MVPKLRILVLEDDPFLEPVLNRILHRINPFADIHWASSAEAAWNLVRNNHYDLFIADILLEGEETGLDFWHACSEAYPQTPLIIMSGIPAYEFLMSIGKDYVAPPFLPKPLNPSISRQLIEKICDVTAERGQAA